MQRQTSQSVVAGVETGRLPRVSRARHRLVENCRQQPLQLGEGVRLPVDDIKVEVPVVSHVRRGACVGAPEAAMRRHEAPVGLPCRRRPAVRVAAVLGRLTAGGEARMTRVEPGVLAVADAGRAR